MKKLIKKIVFIAFLGLMCFEFSGARELSLKTNSRVIMVGRLARPAQNGVNSVPSVTDEETIAVVQNTNNLDIVFGVTYGNLVIRITNQAGVVVKMFMNVNAVAGSTYTIDTQNLGAGTYTLRISDFSGGSLTGEFVIP